MDLISRENTLATIVTSYKGKATELLAHEIVSIAATIDELPSAFEGMTNGEVIQALFDGLVINDNPAMRKYTIPMTYDFWNAPYQKGGEE